tara:strand:+ start:368 stop:751 length:384 start_codon:yes stop_codon:yes gene_type:complete
MELIIERKRQYTDILRNYSIIINNKEFGKIRSGEKKVIEISEGDVLQFEIDTRTSKKIVTNADDKSFFVYNSISNVYLFMAIFIIPILFYFSITTKNYYYSFLSVLFLIYPVYSLYINKQNYLKVKR